MNIWVVEDDDIAANRAFEAIVRLGLKDEVDVFRDRDILWSADLERLPAAEGDVPMCKLDHMPAIVILDLLDIDLQFAAGKYYDRLRRDETDRDIPASFVIIWSVKTGLAEVHSFLSKKPIVDRRLHFTNSKSDSALDASLARALKSWREAQYL